MHRKSEWDLYFKSQSDRSINILLVYILCQIRSAAPRLIPNKLFKFVRSNSCLNLIPNLVQTYWGSLIYQKVGANEYIRSEFDSIILSRGQVRQTCTTRTLIVSQPAHIYRSNLIRVDRLQQGISLDYSKNVHVRFWFATQTPPDHSQNQIFYFYYGNIVLFFNN